MKFMSDTSLSELVTKIKNGFLRVQEISTDTGESNADLDTYKTTGIYIITGDGADEPPGDNKRGYLIVLKDSHFALAQFWIESYVDSFYLDFPIYCRQCRISTWSEWTQYPSLSYLEFLENSLISAINNKIQDSATATTSTWSSDKINTQLGNKLDTSDFTLSNITGTLPITKGGTGATTRSDAFKNLSFENYTCTTFSSDNSYYTDLDDLKSAGNYYVKADDNTHSIMQNFSVVNGWLTVLPSASTQVKQILYRYGSVAGNNDHQIYVRTYFSTGWTEWARVYTTKDIIPIANGGTGTGTTPSMLVDLNSTTADNPYNSSSRPGVTGTLPISKGGTGSTSTPSMIVDLGSTSAASPYGSSPHPGVTGTLPIANGGTGAATVSAALENLGISTANSGNSGSVKIGNILVQWGKVSITNTDTSTVASHTITFDSGLQYSSAPRVFVTPLTSAPDKVRVTAIPTSSGITFYLLRTSNVSNTSVDWVAVGVSA